MSTTNDRFDAALWAALAGEYLSGPDRESFTDDRLAVTIAESNARLLAAHVGEAVDEYSRDPDGIVRPGDRFVHLGRVWVAVDDPEPYATFDEMESAWLDNEEMRASMQYCDHPVWTMVENVKFRVWHDTDHLLHRLDFSANEELQLFEVQAQQFRDDRLVVEALFSESVYQLAAAVHLGTFPDVQHVRRPGPVGQRVLDRLVFAGAA